MILTESKGLRTTLKHGFEFYSSIRGFPDSSVGKESACNAGQPGSIPWLEELLEKGKVTILVLASLVAQMVRNMLQKIQV